MRKLMIAGAAILMLMPVIGAARGRFGVFAGPGFAPYGWYGPGYGYYPWTGAAIPNAGEVKIDTKVKDADVLINGSLAGTTGHLKSMYMRAGSYDIQIRAAGQPAFEQKIYVVAGKTVKLHPDLGVAGAPRS
jgi:hypothetical protein